MPKYRIDELSFIDNKLVQAGDEIETDTEPGTHWHPLDADAKKAHKATLVAEQKRLENIDRLALILAAQGNAATALVGGTTAEVAALQKSVAKAADLY